MSALCPLSAVNRDAFAADWSFNPSATLTQTYDSNFQFIATPLPGITKSDFITSFTPVVSVTGQSEQTTFQFDTTTSGLAYLQNPTYDTVSTNTTASLAEAWSPLLSTSASFGLIHDYTLENSLQESGIITPYTEHYLFNFGLGAQYALSESLNLTASGQFVKNIYPSSPSSATLPESENYQGTITPVWAVSARDNIGFSSNFSDTAYSNATTEKTVTESLFYQRLVTDSVSLKLTGGYYFAMLDFVALTPELVETIGPVKVFRLVNLPETGTSGGFVFGVDLKKDWSEKFSTALSAGRQEYNDVEARSFASTSISGTAIYKLSELTTFNFNARYNTNAQITQGNLTIDYYTVSASIERNLTENLLVRLSGEYDYEIQSSSILNLDKYRTWIDLTYKWPRFLSSH
ncbi:MAG: outer membrane beta-barrel protein [Syntrophobacteraceae bacterium]